MDAWTLGALIGGGLFLGSYFIAAAIESGLEEIAKALKGDD